MRSGVRRFFRLAAGGHPAAIPTPADMESRSRYGQAVVGAVEASVAAYLRCLIAKQVLDLRHAKAALIEILGALGFDDVRTAHDHPAHPNGPAVSIFARRIRRVQ
jgi:hypothetical protein